MAGKLRASRPASRRWGGLAARVFYGIFAAFVLAECVLRVATGTLFLWGDPDIVDPMVGYMLKPGLSLRHPMGTFKISIGDHSTRKNQNPEVPRDRPLTLAVGDSFTYGENVTDEDSWPAILERIMHSRVINGGLPGIGIDQVVLRAEQLSGVYEPDAIIVSFIPDDVQRATHSCFGGHAKPYFEIVDSGLRLHPAVIPAPGIMQRLLSLSLATHVLFYQLVHHDCAGDTGTGQPGQEVACRLMDRLAALGVERNVRIIVMAQPEGPSESTADEGIEKGVLSCATARGLSTFDLFPLLERIPDEEQRRLFSGHMTAEGNGFVARELADFLRTQGGAQQ